VATNATATPTPTVAQDNTVKQSTLTNSITTTVANSYIVANYYNLTYYEYTSGDSWLLPAGHVALLTDANTFATGFDSDGLISGYSEAGTGTVTFEVQDKDGAQSNMYIANLQCVDVHN